MMRRLTEKDRQLILDYVMAEPEYNLFFIGDIANFGFDHPNQQVYVHEVDGRLDSVLLRYMDTYAVYSRTLDYDLQPVVAQIATGPAFCSINGKSLVVDRLAPFFPQLHSRHTYLARAKAILAPANPHPLPRDVHISQLGPEHAADLVELYLQIEENAALYRGREEAATAEVKMNLRGGGRAFGAFSGGRLVAAASTSAENPMAAMVTGVATLPPYRGQGIATCLVSELGTYCLAGGMEFLCLFYDNPAAGRIYRNIGFEEMGAYTLFIKA